MAPTGGPSNPRRSKLWPAAVATLIPNAAPVSQNDHVQQKTRTKKSQMLTRPFIGSFFRGAILDKLTPLLLMLARRPGISGTRLKMRIDTIGCHRQA